MRTVYQVGTHVLRSTRMGGEYEPPEFAVTKEMVQRNAWANHDYNPWFMENSPFGGRIASPPLDDEITTEGLSRTR